jgi:hypothetical protein
MWIPSHVEILGSKVTDEYYQQAVENNNVYEQIVNGHIIAAKRAIQTTRLDRYSG